MLPSRGLISLLLGNSASMNYDIAALNIEYYRRKLALGNEPHATTNDYAPARQREGNTVFGRDRGQGHHEYTKLNYGVSHPRQWVGKTSICRLVSEEPPHQQRDGMEHKRVYPPIVISDGEFKTAAKMALWLFRSQASSRFIVRSPKGIGYTADIGLNCVRSICPLWHLADLG